MRRVFCGLVFVIFGLALGVPARGQEWIGLITDNYAPVQSLHVQPAAIANTPYSYYVNIGGAQFSAVNTKVFKSLTDVFSGKPFSCLENSDEFLIAVDGQLPSFVARLNERSSIGLEVKVLSYEGFLANFDKNARP